MARTSSSVRLRASRSVGVAQWVIDFVFWMHFLRPVFMVEPFDLVRMLVLVAVTSALGFVIGYALAVLWNGLHRNTV